MSRYLIIFKDKKGDKDDNDNNSNNKFCLSVWTILSY